MSYAEQNGNPGNYTIGLVAVVGFHVLLGYALANGLARSVVEVLKAPLDVSLIQEIKPPPPPPPPPPKPRIVRTPPKVSAPPPPAYVPPVEVPVVAPAQPVITATTPEPPPVVEAPPAPKPVAPPVVDVAITCSNHIAVRSQVIYPPQAERMGLSGNVVVDFTVGADGTIKSVGVVRSSNAVFNSAATAAVAKLKCAGQGHDVRVRLPFAFRLDS